MRKFLAALLVLAPMGAVTPALAESSQNCTDVPQAQWMSVADVEAKLTADGYEVRDVQVQGTCYEVKALKDGARVEASVNPATGEVSVGSDHDADE